MSSTRQYMALWALGFETCKMMAEAQTVIAYRMLGMAGIWSVTPGENARMVEEKTRAFGQSMAAATQAALQGRDAGTVMSRALVPIGRVTASNAKRLGKRGFATR